MSARPRSRREIRFRAATLLGLLALVAVLYAPTLDDPWHYDDRAELTPSVRAFAPHVDPSHYRGNAVRWLWAMDYRLGGDDPRGYHVTNLLLHTGAVLALYAVAWLVASPLPPPRRLLAAATAAALFAAHPLATQSVSYLTQRSTSLASLLFLACLAGWMAFRSGEGARRAAGAAVAIVALAIGLHAKPVVLMAPLAILLWEGLARGRMRRDASGRLAGAIVLVALLALTLWRALDFAPAIDVAGSGADTTPSPAAGRGARPVHDANGYALTQPLVVATYLRLALLPSGQRLLWDVVPVESPADVRFLLPVALLLTLAGVAIRIRGRHPGASFGIALFPLALLPTSSIVRSPHLMFEHRAYLPLAGLCLAAGCALGAARRIAAGRAALAAGAAVVLLGGATLRRQAAWDSELALWTDVARRSPALPEARLNLAMALRDAGRAAEAEAQLRAALAANPGYRAAHANLGNLLAAAGRLDEAEAELRAAWERKETAATALGLGNVAMRRGDAAGAERWYGEARDRGDDGVGVRFNLAKALLMQERAGEAAALYATLSDSLAGNAPFANDYGCALLLQGDAAGAVREFLRAVALHPDWEDARRNLERAEAAAAGTAAEGDGVDATGGVRGLAAGGSTTGK